MAATKDGDRGVDRTTIAGDKLLPTLWESPMGDFGVDSGEKLFDKLIDAGALESFPVIKYLVGAGKTIGAIADYILARKVACFLFDASRQTSTSASYFREQLERDTVYRQRVGTAVITQLGRLDDTIKASLAGRLFALVLDDELSYTEYRRAVHSIDRCFTDYLLYLPNLPDGVVRAENDGFEPDILENLYASGLLSNVGLDGGEGPGEGPRGTRYKRNEVARLVVTVVRDY